MIDVYTDEFPPFLELEFERLRIPGEEIGFAISCATHKRKESIACGIQGNVPIAIIYSGEEYAVLRRQAIAFEVFESLYRSVPELVKRSGLIGAEDILDGESYLVKWCDGSVKTRLVLSNPRDIEVDAFGRVADEFDALMKQVRRAKAVPERFPRPVVISPLQSSSSGDIVE